MWSRQANPHRQLKVQIAAAHLTQAKIPPVSITGKIADALPLVKQ